MAQDEVLERVEESFAGLPIWRSAYRPGEPVGVEALTALARELYGEARPAGDDQGATVRSGSAAASAGPCCDSALPFVSRAEVTWRAMATIWS